MGQLPNQSNADDVEWVEKCLSGSTDAIGILIDRYQSPIYNLCYRMTGSSEDAADLTQEAFLKAFQNLSDYQPKHKFFSWLYTIALNLCRNHLKRKGIVKFFSLNQSREEKKTTFDPPSKGPSPEDHLESKEKQTILKALVEALPSKQKNLILLRLNDHLSDAEICKINGITENNLRVQLHQAKMKLFEEYQKRLGQK